MNRQSCDGVDKKKEVPQLERLNAKILHTIMNNTRGSRFYAVVRMSFIVNDFWSSRQLLSDHDQLSSGPRRLFSQ